MMLDKVNGKYRNRSEYTGDIRNLYNLMRSLPGKAALDYWEPSDQYPGRVLVCTVHQLRSLGA